MNTSSRLPQILIFILVLGIGSFLFVGCANEEEIELTIDIHQNKDIIYLSTFAEPPQFAIWLENESTGELRTVFVTHRSGIGDWEGKPAVPVAIPRWFELFDSAKNIDAVSGATPKDENFTINTTIPSNSVWTCWIEMNLAGDFNETFPQFDEELLVEDEFFCGQPALLYKARVKGKDDQIISPELVAQSVFKNEKNKIEPVDPGVDSALKIFESINIYTSKSKNEE